MINVKKCSLYYSNARVWENSTWNPKLGNSDFVYMFDRFCMRDALSKKHRERALRKKDELENIERDSMIASSTRRRFFQSARAFVLLIPIPRSLCSWFIQTFTRPLKTISP